MKLNFIEALAAVFFMRVLGLIKAMRERVKVSGSPHENGLEEITVEGVFSIDSLIEVLLSLPLKLTHTPLK